MVDSRYQENTKQEYIFVNVIGDNLVEIKIHANTISSAVQLLGYVTKSPNSFRLRVI
jgi:hypothetical protein